MRRVSSPIYKQTTRVKWSLLKSIPAVFFPHLGKHDVQKNSQQVGSKPLSQASCWTVSRLETWEQKQNSRYPSLENHPKKNFQVPFQTYFFPFSMHSLVHFGGWYLGWICDMHLPWQGSYIAPKQTVPSNARWPETAKLPQIRQPDTQKSKCSSWIFAHTKIWVKSQLPTFKLTKQAWNQCLFLVPLKGGRWHIIRQLAVYTTYIPLIYCLLGGYMLPTTLYRNLKNPLMKSSFIWKDWTLETNHQVRIFDC